MKTILKTVFLILLLASSALFAQEPKDTASSGGSVAPLFGGMGGPDVFGYTFIDSTDPNCSFQFIDIATTGASVVVGDDVSSGPIPLQGPFNFYGVNLTDIVMTSNGYLSTEPTDTGPDLSNDCPLPVTPSTGGGARIYPLHDDIDLEAGIGNGLFQYFPSCPRPSDVGSGSFGCHVFQWDEAAHFPGGAGAQAFDFQAILYDTTFEIIFQHDDRNPEAGSASTTGIQNEAADDGLTFACDAPASIAPNSAQCFRHPFFIDEDFFPRMVPALGSWGLILLALVLLGMGAVFVRHQQ